jgi:RNA polymerase sigma-70 factor (ECF subfamily)
MNTTSASLLNRLRQPGDQDAWVRFVKLYTPLLFYWARQLGLQPDDASDLVQDVLTALVQHLPEFNYDHRQSFRNWLRTVMRNRWRNNQRSQATAVRQPGEGELSDVAAPESDTLEEAEYRQYLVGRALELMQAEFQPTTWKACWEHIVSGRPAREVASELGMSEGAVYVAKCRVLRRLRSELEGLLD